MYLSNFKKNVYLYLLLNKSYNSIQLIPLIPGYFIKVRIWSKHFCLSLEILLGLLISDSELIFDLDFACGALHFVTKSLSILNSWDCRAGILCPCDAQHNLSDNNCFICQMHFAASESILTGISFYFAHLNVYVYFLLSNYYEEYILKMLLQKVLRFPLDFWL